MQVFKFGGTSLTSLKSFKFILAMLEDTQAKGEDYVLVVSAVAGVTNRLEAIANSLAVGNDVFHQPYREILDLHKGLLKELFGRREAQVYWSQVKGEFKRLHDHLKKCAKKGKCKKRDQDYILGFGELISAGIVTRFLNLHDQDVSFLDAREVIITKVLSLSSSVDIDQSIHNIREHFKTRPGNKVVPGYIASNKLGQMTTIGRGGSDFTAALLGVGLKASAVVKFTDVRGILTCK
jgi:aspartokinase/homoserine dehydrogenase 1